MLSLPYLDRGLQSPDRIAIEDVSGTWTYGELAHHAESAASALLEGRDSLDGERIGLLLEPTKESLAALFGAFEAGAIALPFSTHITPREIAYQLEDAGAHRVVVGESQRARIEESSIGLSVEVLSLTDLVAAQSTASTPTPAAPSPWTESEGSYAKRSSAEHPERFQQSQGGEVALMLYTSGTTGQPKGVVHTHASLINQVDVLRRAWAWTEEDVLLHALPLHHVHGLINGALGALWAGARLRLLPRFDTQQIRQAFAGREATVFYAVPTVYHQLVHAWERQDTATRARWAEGAAALRLAVSGSAALPSTLWQRWRDITGQALLERYGMTEIGMALSNPYDAERRPGTVGQSLPGMDIRLVDESGVDVSPDEPGEIWVRSDSLFREYWRRPEATAESFAGDYFRTGDIAQVDDGYYRILGRASSDIIKSGGYKLSALEIEAVILEHPSVSEVAVVGSPDEEWGEVVTAFIVAREGCALTLEELRTFCADKLSAYKHPRRLHLLDSMPRNAMGKTVKGALRDRLTSQA